MGLTKLIAQMGLTRDSLSLKVAAIVAALTYLGTMPPPWTWTYEQWIQTGLAGALWYLGQLKTSGLPGENDDKRVSGPGARSFVLPLLLAGALVSSGCLPKTPPAVVDPAPTAEQVQQVRNEAEKLAKAVREAWAMAIQAGRLADQTYAAGLIPPATMQKINQAGIDAANKSEAFEAFARTVTTEPSLRVTARELLKVFDDFILQLANGKQSGDTIRAALAAVRAYLGVQ